MKNSTSFSFYNNINNNSREVKYYIKREYMNFDVLTKDNIDLYCAKSYDNRQCTTLEEYIKDISSIRYIKTHMNRLNKDSYEEDKVRIRQILNYIISFFNVFRVENAIRILCYYFRDEEQRKILFTMFYFLNVEQEYIFIDECDVIDVFDVDENLYKELEKL